MWAHLQDGLLAHALEMGIIALMNGFAAPHFAATNDGGVVALQLICHHG